MEWELTMKDLASSSDCLLDPFFESGTRKSAIQNEFFQLEGA